MLVRGITRGITGGISRGLVPGAGGGGGGGSTTPLISFLSSETSAGVYDLQAANSLWQDAAGTTAVTSGTDPVRRIDDQTSNGLNLVAPSDAARLSYSVSGEVISNQLDGVDDQIAVTFTAATLTSDMTIMLAIKTTDTKFSPLAGQDSVHFLASVEDGSASGTFDLNSGTPAYLVDGVTQSWSTRDDVHAALADGAWHILEITAADMSSWSRFSISGYVNAGWFLAGNIGDVIFAPTANLDRTGARAEMASRYGVTL